MSSIPSRSLVIVGTGIKTVSHLTLEACGYIRNADIVYYLVNETLMQNWIVKEAKCAESLDKLYRQSEFRIENYQAITQHIVNSLDKFQHVCVALYGHPTVFANPALAAVQKARKLGISTTICPGISAEDCLYADFAFDPGSVGCQSFEATDFIRSERIFDPRSHLVLWQVGAIDVKTQADSVDKAQQQKGLEMLQSYLCQAYPHSHSIYLYTASLYHGQSSKIISLTLDKLVTASANTLSTLYVPPISKA